MGEPVPKPMEPDRQRLSDAAGLAREAIELAKDTNSTYVDQNTLDTVVQTDGSEISQQGDNSFRATYATRSEASGTYSTPQINSVHGPDAVQKYGVTDLATVRGRKVAVERPLGNGGVYSGQIGGKHVERASAIVLSRAAKDVGKSVTAKAIETAERAKRINF